MRRMKFSRLTLLVAAIVVVFIQACSPEEESFLEQQVKKDDQILTEYLESNQIEAQKTLDGVFFHPIVSNESGERPAVDDVAYIYYTVRLLNGDSITGRSATMGEPVPFLMNSQNIVPPGINSGVAQMRIGEKFRLYIPSASGYWNYASDDIPAYSNLMVDVELVSTFNENEQKEYEKGLIEDFAVEAGIDNELESFSSGLNIYTIADGNGDKPLMGESLKVKYKGMLMDSTVFDETTGSQTFTFAVGGNGTIPGWEEGIPKLNKGTKALLLIPSHLAYGKSDFLTLPSEIRSEYRIPPYSTLMFEVEVLNQ